MNNKLIFSRNMTRTMKYPDPRILIQSKSSFWVTVKHKNVEFSFLLTRVKFC